MTENRMVIGPFAATDLGRLTEIFDAAGVAYAVEENPERVQEAEDTRIAREPRTHPTYDGPEEIFMLIFPRAQTGLIREELIRIGKPFLIDSPPEINDAPEYHCPVCSFTSDNPQLCPEHRVPLLEFSDWVAARREGGAKTNRYFVIVFVAIVLALLFWLRPNISWLTFFRHH
jgi:hypothetical protein